MTSTAMFMENDKRTIIPDEEFEYFNEELPIRLFEGYIAGKYLNFDGNRFERTDECQFNLDPKIPVENQSEHFSKCKDRMNGYIKRHIERRVESQINVVRSNLMKRAMKEFPSLSD